MPEQKVWDRVGLQVVRERFLQPERQLLVQQLYSRQKRLPEQHR